MKNKKMEQAQSAPALMPTPTQGIIESLRASWFLWLAIGAAIYWVARMDASLDRVHSNTARIIALESRMAAMDTGIAQVKLKIDGVRDDLVLIKRAVIR